MLSFEVKVVHGDFEHVETDCLQFILPKQVNRLYHVV